MGNVKPGKAVLSDKKRITVQMKKARGYVHLYESGWSQLRCGACGLSESNPIHDFREPPGIGRI